MAATQREEIRRAISHYFHRYRHVQPEIRGRDLKEMGIPPGPIYAKILNRILDARLNGEVRSREEETALARRLAWRELEAGEGKERHDSGSA
jgi:tRNA nucleotidyltransferase (CCA-adding enzyme)